MENPFLINELKFINQEIKTGENALSKMQIIDKRERLNERQLRILTKKPHSSAKKSNHTRTRTNRGKLVCQIGRFVQILAGIPVNYKQ